MREISIHVMRLFSNHREDESIEGNYFNVVIEKIIIRSFPYIYKRNIIYYVHNYI